MWRYHFPSHPPLEKIGKWEGSQHEGPGQDKKRTDRDTVEGQSLGPESREGAALSEKATFPAPTPHPYRNNYVTQSRLKWPPLNRVVALALPGGCPSI